MKGTTLLSCMRQHLKDRWVTANDVRTYCARAGGYTREVLDEAAKKGLIEKREEVEYKVYYRIDPPLGHDSPLCPFEPNVPYEKSVCTSLEKRIEDCVEWKHGGGRPESCDLLDHLERETSSQFTYTSLASDSEFFNDFPGTPLDSFPYKEEPHINIKTSLVV